MDLYKVEQSEDIHLQKWKKDALEAFHQKLQDKERVFPCIPATQGYALNHFRYGFIGDPRVDSTVNSFAQLLKKYSEESRSFGNYTSLIVFFETPTELMNSYSVEDYEQLFWKILTEASSLDEKPWPDHIPTDPHDPVWEYCFHGEPYFMYCATPSHQNRQSRYFPFFMMAITPRWVLEKFNKNKSMSDKIKENIRRRMICYDSISIHPDLKTYGTVDNYEWKQYFLHDDESSLSKCPYHKFLRFIGKDRKNR